MVESLFSNRQPLPVICFLTFCRGCALLLFLARFSIVRSPSSICDSSMNLLFRILYAQKCSSTHHRLAMDALRYLKASDADAWCRLFLVEIEQYIDGSKAPDKKFRDFRNHVLHVRDNFWGGAVPAAELWYKRLVSCLRDQEWRRAVYCAGVLTHYITDPFMPLHTGQTEDEAAVHKLVEWGTTGAYRDLVATLPAARGIHNWKPPVAEDPGDWLAVLIIEGAMLANDSYDLLIDHYDPVRGQRNAADGMDTSCQEAIAHLLGRCIRSLAWVLDRAIAESNARPPSRSITTATVLSVMSTPVFWLTGKLRDREDREAVKAILQELRQTGRVIHSLPEDDRTVRQCHAEEVLGISENDLAHQHVRRPGTQFRIATPEEIRERRFRKNGRRAATRLSPEKMPRLSPADDVVDAPSIGPRTAARLRSIGIRTVADLLAADPQLAEAELEQRWITDELFGSWQQQAQLMCFIPCLRGIDAQLLVATGITTVTDLARADVAMLQQLMSEYAATREGQRIVRSSRLADRDTVRGWIEAVLQNQHRAA